MFFNLVELIDRADEMDVDDGMKAYQRYNDLMIKIAAEYSVPPERTIAAFVALSPNSDYLGNLRSLITMLEAGRQGLSYECATVSTYNACRARAALYLSGTPFLDHAKGLKTRAFYQNILEPEWSGPVTVDGHMYHAWAGTKGGMKDANVTTSIYRQIAKDIRLVATYLGIRPHEAQAILWFARKREQDSIYDPQYRLLTQEQGFQRTAYELHEIIPYSINDPNQRDTSRRPLRRTSEMRSEGDPQNSFSFDGDA